MRPLVLIDAPREGGSRFIKNTVLFHGAEDLVKSKNLPFMAMLRNLRNLINAGVSSETHKEVIGRLKSSQQVANSKQLSAAPFGIAWGKQV